jgi:hypothetical protein
MNNWWKDPRLDDEGTYDYLVEELPKDYARWEFTKETWKCDSCGNYRHLMLNAAHHFYCWDGWDSMSYSECWRCRLHGNIRDIKCKIKKGFKKRIETFKMTIELYDIGSKSLSDCYKLAKKIVK